MNQQPFALTRWDSPNPPSPGVFDRWLAKSGLSAETVTLPTATQTEEMKFAEACTRILLSGTLQCAMPGYGVVDLQPGDILEIQGGILHDLRITGSQGATFLLALLP